MRLWMAGGLSVLIHGALMALPSGHLALADFSLTVSPPSFLHQPGRPAPLTVSLGPQSVRLPGADVRNTSYGAGGSEKSATAPALDSTAADIPAHADHRGTDEVFGLPLPTPLGVPSPQYFSHRELSEHATMLTELPGLPDDPVKVPGAGPLVITLWINELGLVDRVTVITSQVDSVTERAVVTQFERMRFSPAQRDGLAVKSRMKIRVDVLPPGKNPTGASAREN